MLECLLGTAVWTWQEQLFYFPSKLSFLYQERFPCLFFSSRALSSEIDNYLTEPLTAFLNPSLGTQGQIRSREKRWVVLVGFLQIQPAGFLISGETTISKHPKWHTVTVIGDLRLEGEEFWFWVTKQWLLASKSRLFKGKGWGNIRTE